MDLVIVLLFLAAMCGLLMFLVRASNEGSDSDDLGFLETFGVMLAAAYLSKLIGKQFDAGSILARIGINGAVYIVILSGFLRWRGEVPLPKAVLISTLFMVLMLAGGVALVRLGVL